MTLEEKSEKIKDILMPFMGIPATRKLCQEVTEALAREGVTYHPPEPPLWDATAIRISWKAGVAWNNQK